MRRSPSWSEVMEMVLAGQYNDKSGLDEVCKDTAGPDTCGERLQHVGLGAQKICG